MSDHHDEVITTLDPEFFEDPTTFPGASSRMLSPDEIWDWAEPCGPVGAVPEHFGLAEDKVESIRKQGIRICGHDFTGPDLVRWTTGAEEPPNPMFVRYDRALAARGTLREAELILEREDGTREVVAVLHRDRDMPDRASVSEFRLAYRRAVSSFCEELEEQEDRYRKIEAHEAALKEFYHTRPEGGPSRIPLTKPWQEDAAGSVDVGDAQAQRQEEALEALDGGPEEPSAHVFREDSTSGGPAGTSATDGLVDMLGPAEEAGPVVGPKAHPKHRRRTR